MQWFQKYKHLLWKVNIGQWGNGSSMKVSYNFLKFNTEILHNFIKHVELSSKLIHKLDRNFREQHRCTKYKYGENKNHKKHNKNMFGNYIIIHKKQCRYVLLVFTYIHKYY